MGKNSAKANAKKAAKLAAKKGITNQAAKPGVSLGNLGAATKQNTAPVVKDLSDIATLVSPTPSPTLIVKPKLTFPKPEPPVTPPAAVIATEGKYKDGYVLETIFKEDGNPAYTKVMVEGKIGWEVILCYQPAVTISVGTLIRYIPGEHNGKETVTNPVIVEKNTPLSRLFTFLQKKSENTAVEEVTLAQLAKGYMSMNHAGKDESDIFNNFLGSQEILKVIGQLANGRWIVAK